MTTSHERAAHALLSRLLMDEQSAAALTRTRQRLATGTHYSEDYLAAAGQIHRFGPRRWPPHQAAAFMDLHFHVAAGRYAILQVEVGQTPLKDAARAANAAALSNLPEPFMADLDLGQNAADEDGTLSWERPVIATRCTGVALLTRDGSEPVTAPVTVPASEIPLEVGTTLPSRTLLHLKEDGGVARWAYGSTDLYLLINLRHALFGTYAEEFSLT